jgi:hypothetical protein
MCSSLFKHSSIPRMGGPSISLLVCRSGAIVELRNPAELNWRLLAIFKSQSLPTPLRLYHHCATHTGRWFSRSRARTCTGRPRYTRSRRKSSVSFFKGTHQKPACLESHLMTSAAMPNPGLCRMRCLAVLQQAGGSKRFGIVLRALGARPCWGDANFH